MDATLQARITTRPPTNGRRIISALGVAQIFAWGSSYYLLTVLAEPVAADTGWPLTYVVGGVSLALLVSGLISPKVGRLIAACGGRPVLSGGAVLLALGLATIGLAPSLTVFLGGWAIIGIGMGASLYDPAFSTLGRLYGAAARHPITMLTLFGGFASTVCWPISAWLVDLLGWRGTCLAYAVVQLVVCLPLIWFTLPSEPWRPLALQGKRGRGGEIRLLPRQRAMLVLQAVTLVVAGLLVTVISIHLFAMLHERGLSLALAVSLGMLIGPAQVGGRVLDLAFGSKAHPIWTLLVACSLTAAGVLMLFSGIPLPGLALVLYGAGNGIWTIARGALPLVLFGERDYPIIMGRLALPMLIAQAAGPSIGALAMQFGGAEVTFLLVTLLAIVNVAVAATLILVWRGSVHL